MENDRILFYDAIWISNLISIREWCSYGGLTNGPTLGGIYCLSGLSAIDAAYWNVATISDAIWMHSNIISLMEWRAYGRIDYIGNPVAGISYLTTSEWLALSAWTTATIIDAMYINSNYIDYLQWRGYGAFAYGIQFGGPAFLHPWWLGGMVSDMATRPLHS